MVTKVTITSKFIKNGETIELRASSRTVVSMMASSFRTVMAALLGTVGEYVYLWDKLL